MTKRKNKRKHIQQKKYEDHNISSLEDHQRHKGKLTPPLKTLENTGKMNSISWSDKGLLDMLWAAILSGNLERSVYLDLYRRATINVRERDPNYEAFFFTHSVLALVDQTSFELFTAPLYANERARRLLGILSTLDNLPDKERWAKVFPRDPGMEDLECWNILARAVSENLYHQSQAATDIRWIKVMYKLISGGIYVNESMSERMEEFRLYPDRGDQRAVRPSIRSMEIMLRGSNSDADPKPFEVPEKHKAAYSAEWIDKLWAELFKKTGCILNYDEKSPVDVDVLAYVDAILVVVNKLVDFYADTTENTNVNPKREAVFGLTLVALNAAVSMAFTHAHHLAQGRIVLRSIVEAFITLKYLCHSDSEKLWQQYRTYGVGQAKLAFLKAIREKEVPDFLNLEELEQYANEDAWLEYVSVDLSHWADLNLRKMAELAGVKDIYDKYYDWTSGYSHSHWGAVRDTVFMTCLNPLHRFHRMPAPGKLTMPSTLPDAAKICNLILDLLNQQYPPFKPRVKHPAPPPPSPAPKGQGE